ncbi:MAG: polyprenyl synthetase family protein, partial [Candidatus Altarchaeaceae archaeon]
MNDFVEILNEYREKVFNELIKYIPENYDKSFVEILSEYPLRKGKYLRPTLLILTNEMFGGNLEKALNTAVAMQLSEEWILIHDDIEDNSNMRRNKPCLHRIYGVPAALNAGDALHIIMWNALIKNREILGENLTFKIMEIFYDTLLKTAEGQHLEIKWTKEVKENFSDEDYYKIVERKTCLYSITMPMILGAVIANVDE